MIRKQLELFLHFGLLVWIIIPTFAKSSEITESKETMAYYFDLIQSGNIETAQMLWNPADIEIAERLNIQYDAIDIKIDCRSPLMTDYQNVRQHLEYGLNSHTKLGKGNYRWKFQTDLKNIKADYYYYYTEEIDGDIWLTTSYSHLTKLWQSKQSRYVRFFLHPDAVDRYNKIGAEALDAFIEKIAGKIGLDKSMMQLLEQKKIYYYLCPKDIDVFKLTGRRKQGFYDKGIDAICATGIADFNSVAKLLINLNSKDRKIKTIPFLQEGFASYLGGYSNRGAEVTLGFGKYLYDYEIMGLDSIMMMPGHKDTTGIIDIAVPIASSFNEYLYQSLGDQKYFEFYNQLSGDDPTLGNMTVDKILSEYESVSGKIASEIKVDFGRFLSGYSIGKSGIYPGSIDSGEELINSEGLIFRADGNRAIIECYLNNPDSQIVEIEFDLQEFNNDYRSRLYFDHYPDIPLFDKFRYSIRLDKNEAGLYDYATDRILAKFVNSSSIKTNYYDPKTKIVKFYFEEFPIDPNTILEVQIKINR